jgi:arsenite methyltransferase
MSIFSQELFESDTLLSICGNVARPGGFILTDMAIESCALKKGDMLLDIGCGVGASVAHLSEKYGLKALGIDSSETMLSKAHSCFPKINVYHGYAEALSFADITMDAVLIECSLSKFQNSQKALLECHRVLKPGGWLIISDVYSRKLNKPNTDIGGIMSCETLMRLIKESSFKLMLFEDHTEKLTQLMFDIIMKYGSMKNFWDNVYAGQCAYALLDVKLGYYLLIAQKQQ